MLELIIKVLKKDTCIKVKSFSANLVIYMKFLSKTGGIQRKHFCNVLTFLVLQLQYLLFQKNIGCYKKNKLEHQDETLQIV